MRAHPGRFEHAAGFILAGGASSRMGCDKAMLRIGGVPLVTRAATLLEPLVGSAVIVGPRERYASLGLAVIPDERPGLGPLGGIATALNSSRCPANVVLACDMPFLTPDWLVYLLRRAMASSADAVLAQTARGIEPLCAVYRRSCAPILTAAIACGVRKVKDGLGAVIVETIPEGEWKPFDPQGLLFKNINAAEDYEQARSFFKEEASW